MIVKKVISIDNNDNIGMIIKIVTFSNGRLEMIIKIFTFSVSSTSISSSAVSSRSTGKPLFSPPSSILYVNIFAATKYIVVSLNFQSLCKRKFTLVAALYLQVTQLSFKLRLHTPASLDSQERVISRHFWSPIS